MLSTFVFPILQYCPHTFIWTKDMFNGCRTRSFNSFCQTCVPSQLLICSSKHPTLLIFSSLLSKLKAEADVALSGNSSKKSTVDTHRGDNYQFCYFLRKTEPHSVVVKSRSFHAVQRSPRLEVHPEKVARKKRKQIPVGSRKPTKRPRINDDDEDLNGSDVETQGPTTPSVSRGDEVLIEETLHLEEEEEKPKPALSLKYRGFTIYGHCLCIVVEPWPVVRTMPSDVAPIFKSSTGQPQSQSEPLFLADDSDGEDNANLPADVGQFVNKSYLDQVLAGIDVESEDEDTGGMMEFSQVLQNVGDSRAGAMNDDDDMDGSVLFGDADERREL